LDHDGGEKVGLMTHAIIANQMQIWRNTFFKKGRFFGRGELWLALKSWLLWAITSRQWLILWFVFFGGVIGVRNLCCNWAEFFIDLWKTRVQFPRKLVSFGFCLSCFCFGRLVCNLLSNQIWKFCMQNICAHPSCFKNWKLEYL
jgi:hypothetical protein